MTEPIVKPNTAWPPTTEEHLRIAAASGLLEETRYLDIKSELKWSDSGSREIAKDIAAFAFDGGMIVIGVGEENRRPAPKPIPLAGLAERIEQIGLSRVEDPVQVRTKEIHGDDERCGYLIVSVPRSSRAPHMADGKYYRRGDKTNVVLSHSEVLQYHELRLTSQRKAADGICQVK